MSYTFVHLLEDFVLTIMQSAEASFSIHKKEELYRRHYTSEADLIRGIHQFIDFYNKVLCASNRLFNTKTAKKKPHRKAQNRLNHAVFHWVYATKKIPSRLKRKISFLDAQPSFSIILYIV